MDALLLRPVLSHAVVLYRGNSYWGFAPQLNFNYQLPPLRVLNFTRSVDQFKKVDGSVGLLDGNRLSPWLGTHINAPEN